jgi:hypothetical protein
LLGSQKNVDITGKMQAEGGHKNNGFAVLSPEVAQTCDEYFAARETVGGDNYGENGYLRTVIGGLNIAYIPASSPFPTQFQVNRIRISSLNCSREEAQQSQPHCRC